MEYKERIVSGKEIIYKDVKFDRKENNDFINVNGDILNPIHYDEKAAHALLERMGLGNLDGIIVAGEIIKQKLLFLPEIGGLPYKMSIGFHHPLVLKDEAYVDFILENVKIEPHSYHHKFTVRKDGYSKPIMDGEVVSIGELLWSLDGKRPEPLKEPILNIDGLIAGENVNGRFHNSINENYTDKSKDKSVMIASSFIPPQMINVIKNAVSKKLGEDDGRQYVFNSQEITVYRKKVDLNSPLSFYFSEPRVRPKTGRTFCKTTLHAMSNNECILECIILGAAI